MSRSAANADRLPECRPIESESSYPCPSCGEEIVVPIDRSAGRSQEYVEDCPVCCRPLVLRISFEDDPEADRDGGDVRIEVRAE